MKNKKRYIISSIALIISFYAIFLFLKDTNYAAQHFFGQPISFFDAFVKRMQRHGILDFGIPVCFLILSLISICTKKVKLYRTLNLLIGIFLTICLISLAWFAYFLSNIF